MQKLVLTDFDGTYIKGDSFTGSLIYFPKFSKFIKVSPFLILNVIKYLLGICTRNDVKEQNFRLIFRGMKKERTDQLSEGFISGMHIFPKVRKKIEELRSLGYKVIVVTASTDIYMEKVCRKFGFDECICTLTELKEGSYTGEIKGRNCNYEEKVRRIKSSPYWNENSIITAFGNSKGDEAMLSLAGESYTVDRKGNLKKVK